MPYQRIEYNIDRGETRTPEFLEGINANGRVPVLETERGEFLPESNAILCYLAAGTPLLPEDPLERARYFSGCSSSSTGRLQRVRAIYPAEADRPEVSVWFEGRHMQGFGKEDGETFRRRNSSVW